MKTPSDSELIYDLMESFGQLWEPEPPLYSCYCDVVVVVTLVVSAAVVVVVVTAAFSAAAVVVAAAGL